MCGCSVAVLAQDSFNFGELRASMPRGERHSLEAWLENLRKSALAQAFRHFYLLLITYRKQTYVKVGATGEKEIKDRAWTVCDKSGRDLPYEVIAAVPEAIPKFDLGRGSTLQGPLGAIGGYSEAIPSGWPLRADSYYECRVILTE